MLIFRHVFLQLRLTCDKCSFVMVYENIPCMDTIIYHTMHTKLIRSNLAV